MATSDLHPPFDRWEAAEPKEVKNLLHELDGILAGGYALEIFVGEVYRSHGDLDIILPRTHQAALTKHFPPERIFVAEQAGHLFPWDSQKFYERPIQDIWILAPELDTWWLQVMLVDEEKGEWIYKREESIRLPWKEIFFWQEGMKILKPEIQLLYKSKGLRPKDQLDFTKVSPLLGPEARSWLKEALRYCYGEHAWVEALR